MEEAIQGATSAPVVSADPANAAAPAAAGKGPSRLVRLAQRLVGVTLFVLVVVAVVREWPSVSATASRLSAEAVAGSLALAAAGLVTSMLVWRQSLAELGSRLPVRPAAKIYLIGQLGKYIPGSLWAILVQMEYARRLGAPRTRTLAASMMAIAINLATGLVVGLVAVRRAHLSGIELSGVVAAAAVCAVALTPPILSRAIRLGMRVLRQPLAGWTIAWGTTVETAALSLLGWIAYGLSLWLLVVGVGGDAGRALPLCLGGAALAMVAGFVIVVAPSGIGVREAVLVAVLASVLSHGDALAVALVLRLEFTVADLVLALATVPVGIRAAA